MRLKRSLEIESDLADFPDLDPEMITEISMKDHDEGLEVDEEGKSEFEDEDIDPQLKMRKINELLNMIGK